jgi:LDH2 family malate/lactate/ureidoglycolate dehydrogenase
MVDDLKASTKRPGVSEILVPGERSSRIAAENSKLGVPLAQETLAELKQWCVRLSVPFPFAETES